MTAWGVFGVIAAIVAFGVTVGTPLVRLNSNITRLNVVLELLQKQFEAAKKDNEAEHVALWDKVEKQEDTISEHETRITVLEHTS